jgi:hypothetical protein
MLFQWAKLGLNKQRLTIRLHQDIMYIRPTGTQCPRGGFQQANTKCCLGKKKVGAV